MGQPLFLHGVILLGFALLMFKLIVTGQVQQLLAPKMMPFLYFAMGTLFLLGIMQMWRSDRQGESACCDCARRKQPPLLRSFVAHAIVIAPILTGLAFSHETLDSTVAAKRGVQFGAMGNEKREQPSDDFFLEQMFENGDGNSTQEEPVDQKALAQTMLEKKKIVLKPDYYLAALEILYSDIDRFIGKEIEMIGFVYREPDFGKEKAVIARFSIACCVTDASVYGIIAKGRQLSALQNDEWVKVKGVIRKAEHRRNILPHIEIEDVIKVQQPDEPYIYEGGL